MPDADVAIERIWMMGAGQEPFDFDAVVRESHESEIDITENPVEGGAPVHDHAVIKAKRLEIEASVGDVVLRVAPAVFDSDASRSVTAWEKLVNLQESREPFTVITGLKRYTNMMLKRLSTEQDVSTSAILNFRASLCEVLIVNTESVTFPPRKKGKTKRQADKKTDGGEKKADPPKDDTERAGILFKGLFGGEGDKSVVDGLVSRLPGGS